jgi:hypothetical protein
MKGFDRATSIDRIYSAKVRSRRVRNSWPKTTKQVNATASTSEVVVSGKNVKFSARTVKAQSFAV